MLVLLILVVVVVRFMKTTPQALQPRVCGTCSKYHIIHNMIFCKVVEHCVCGKCVLLINHVPFLQVYLEELRMYDARNFFQCSNCMSIYLISNRC